MVGLALAGEILVALHRREGGKNRSGSSKWWGGCWECEGGPPGIFKFCIKQRQNSAAAGTGGGGKSAKNVNQETEIRAY